MKKTEFDEFYGRDRDFEIKHLSKTVKEVRETLPEELKTIYENHACHLTMASYDIARNLFRVMMLTPKDKRNKVLEDIEDKLGYALACSVGDDSERPPEFNEDKDYDDIDMILKKLSRKFSPKYI